MNDLEAINGCLNLVELATMAGSKLRKVGHEWRGNCPLHGGNNKNGFAIYNDEKRWTCFTGDCGSGDALGFVMKQRKVGLLAAIDFATGGQPLSREEIERIHIEQAAKAEAELKRSIENAQRALAELQKNRLWVKYHEQLEKSSAGKLWWEGRGVPVDFQNFWQLGYQSDRRIWVGNEMVVPSASIPLFANGWQCQQVKYRLIGAPDEYGKYRYEYEDLPAPIFMGDPDNEHPETVVIVEGEIKAMVTFATLDKPGWQVLGIPGKSTPIERVQPFTEKATDVIVCCDPDTGNMNEDIAHELGAGRCRIIDTPMKIDDYILMAGINKQQLMNLFNQSRRIV